jgi:hypothetical protein
MVTAMGDLYDDNCWYLATARGEKSGPRLVALCRELSRQQSILLANTDKCIAAFQWGGDAKDCAPGDHFPIEEDLITFNAAQNAVETVFAKVVKSTIALMPLTNGGGYLQRDRAKKMGKAIDGVLADSEFDVVDEEMVMDALVTDHGAGACIIHDCDDHIEIEALPIEDVWFDEAEVRRRSPRCCYYIPRDGIDKYVMIERFANPKDDGKPGWIGTAEQRRDAILRAASNPASWRTSVGASATQRVDYYEGWHLPSGEVEESEDEESGERVCRHDGRHVIAVEGDEGTLFDGPWEDDFFPIELLRPSPEAPAHPRALAHARPHRAAA